MEITRESMEVDVLIVGAGPAGLSTAIRLAQLAAENQTPLEICVLEKGSEVGAHILSGAVFEPRALNELLPNWESQGAPLTTKATQDTFLLLTETKTFKLPTPPQMNNEGNYIISLGALCQWLGQQAEALGVQIFPGFPASEVLYDEQDKVIGVTIGDMGISKEGQQKPSFQPGINLLAKYTVFAEGARGSLTKKVVRKYNLQKDCQPQTYGLGLKELWEVPAEQDKAGEILHTIGWPLDKQTYGGSFLYYLRPDLISIGFVVGLDYENPYLSPFEEFQRFKQHARIRPLLEKGRRISYGARTINEGGIQSIPKLSFPGGVLAGCAAGFLNVPKIKGSHTAMKSGMLAAESIYEALIGEKPAELSAYETSIKQSWVWSELSQARNLRPAFQKGLWFGLAYSALDTYFFRGKAPWTLSHHEDHRATRASKHCKPIVYPKPDNKISFDRLTSVSLSGTFHEEDQPVHLKLTDPNKAINTNLATFDAPEQRYCPAGVYEVLQTENNKPYLQINGQNCLHCKACDIKDPTQNITWTPPEGGGGPNYSNM